MEERTFNLVQGDVAIVEQAKNLLIAFLYAENLNEQIILMEGYSIITGPKTIKVNVSESLNAFQDNSHEKLN